ncbi:uncharacterized protein LOC111283901 isoform X1 [Durio zibethinus]|uniref:Uncharacterized protein LOC111283901 isoform X1 n=1 Tax=Durio zibethinus TaxID=66656 RepID=A0A6P5XK91_DURZI|nr:uncharacterized protein LOC111283901 isoform X1 [Durio zibethinus]
MEMDTTLLDNHIKGIEDESAEQLHATCSFMDEIFGDPQVIPRVGDQYQAEIPPLVGQHRSLQVVKEPTDSKVIMNVPNPFPMGLPIPLFWTKTEVESINGALEFENNEESRITSSHGCAEYKVESLDSVLGDGKNMRGYSKLQPTTKTKKDIDLLFPKEPKSKMNQVHRVPCPLPGSLSEVWKAIELDIFLLGLYIFGKNLILVKNFVESKGMGEILSFYYGKFYRSDGYCRWSECRKSRGRRCILGQKLFTGWRQQQLLSQLFSHISKEDQDMLLEVSKTFGEGKVSFEEYVFTIKNTVGIGLLIEAIGIGKGKQDHTGNAMEPVKVNHVVSFRPEIPVGKACSALTSADIIKFLTGDFRLSKARSSDLFWEAVWPRLLARGWHSEQPKDQVLSGSKNSLVFLIPGVKKFSKRRLVKGNHYFDSVSDVLNKVASEPGLLELEIEVSKGSRENKENKWDPTIKQDPDFMSNKRIRYLKPRNSGCNRDLMKFTIVDTSLVQGAERSKVRELRSLPLEATSLSTPSSISSDSEEDTSDDSEDEAEENSASHAAEAMADEGECVDLSDCVNSNSNTVIPHTSDTSIISVENHESHHASLLDDEGQKVVKYNFVQNVHSSDSKYLAPVSKEQGLTDCTNGESSCSVENISAARMLNEDTSHCRSNSSDACEDMVFQTGSQDLSPASSLSKVHRDEGKEGNVTQNCLHRQESPIMTRLHTLIDLNVPQVSMDFETNGPFVTETVKNSENSCAHISFFQSEIPPRPEPLKLPNKGAEVNQHPIMHNRRQSTRNRPLTTKALEALECGFFSPKRKRKAAEALQNNSQRVRGRPVVSSIFRNGASNPNMEEN